MEAGLGDHAEYRLPRQLREQIHGGKLKTWQNKGCFMPLKQSFEFRLAVKIVREREQKQKRAGGSFHTGRTTSVPINSSSSQWDGSENSHFDGFYQSSSDSDDHFKRTSERRVKKTPHITSHVCVLLHL